MTTHSCVAVLHVPVPVPKALSLNQVTKITTPRALGGNSSRFAHRSSSARTTRIVERVHIRTSRSSARVSSGQVVMDATFATQPDYFQDDTRPIILFDGVCNMCNGGVNFVLDFDRSPKGKLRFAALQSDAGRALLARCGRSPDDISSIVLVEENGCSIKSDAILKIGEYLMLPFPVAAVFAMQAPLFFRDGVYDQIADNRYNMFGKSNSCRLSDGRFEERFVQ
mmetsp:Transcript_35528/g.59887  ORF Transcript_35528/g.59887 Transcript_35528/m.59887 type:complete len:224 (+) Transcript_35528:111-782(+)|eukprot:CAMPEP_0198210650 /NCGR_PEP_ID=MMETSP1445-20131203/21391_1 /TAXON_ID=36898 /ORGANISM="Pyramimonas sp., Strain CCMP2087" /LENGTH=223 /DNA_ID=CAMNT_0043884769 /DNA_START=92 /DNA_END=763 /DNA_ORIENTATION=+